MPSKKKEKQPKPAETDTQSPPVITTEEEARAAATPPTLVISSIDKSLINTEGRLLTGGEINRLRRKLKAKFH